jgi:CelD/BcsL family acetyltransferase involved in cellulose biosynthesis
MAEIVEVNDFAALAPWRGAWDRLWRQTPGASFFQTFDWLEIYWRYFGEGQRLRVLILQDCGQPQGIVPLAVTREATRLGKLRVLNYPLAGWGSFYGPLGTLPTAALTLALAHIAATSRDWELLDLRYIERDAIDRGRTQTALAAAGLDARAAVACQAAMIDFSQGWDAYWASRESKFRNNLRRQRRKLQDLGEVKLVRHRPAGLAAGDGDLRFDLYDTCVELARKSWQGSSNKGTTLSHDCVREYLRETHAAAARLGCVDVNLLYVDEQPVAFAYNYHHGGTVQGIRNGYHPDFAKIGVGNMMYLYMLEDSFARGDRLLDLGSDYLEVKRFWWTHLVDCYHYLHYPPTAGRAQLLRLKRWLCRA